MDDTVERTDAREWSDEQMADLFSDGFPDFIVADKLAAQYIDRIRESFPEWNLTMVDAEQQPVAAGWGIPLRWDGTMSDLPSGYTDATIRAVENRQQDIATDTFVICGAGSRAGAWPGGCSPRYVTSPSRAAWPG